MDTNDITHSVEDVEVIELSVDSMHNVVDAEVIKYHMILHKM